MKSCIFMSAVALFVSTFMSCDKSGNTDNQYGSYINSNIDLYVTDEKGNDLLMGENAYTEEDIDIIYYDSQGNEHVFYNPLLGCPKRINLCNNGHDIELGYKPWLRIFLFLPEDGSDSSITYVRFGNNPIDTFKAEWSVFNANRPQMYGGNSTYVTKVWLNNELIFDKELDDYELPSIVRPYY